MRDNLSPLLIRLQEVARNRQTIAYSSAAELVTLDMSSPYDRKQIGALLGELSSSEHEQGRPMISAVVVAAGSQTPGKGFFNLARRLGRLTDGDEDLFFVEELRRVHDYWSGSGDSSKGSQSADDSMDRAIRPKQSNPDTCTRAGMPGLTADALRNAFRAVPEERREAKQAFSIRVWRSLSWLERAQSLDASDFEGRFISLWIGFNALYGRLDDERRAWGDREAWGAFIATIWCLDRDGQLPKLLRRRQVNVFKLIGSKYLTTGFWENGDTRQATRDQKQVMNNVEAPKVWRTLFERLYVMRHQVFHGASTKGSKLNRRTLQGSTAILAYLLPEMLRIMIEYGVDEDWGPVCFAPV